MPIPPILTISSQNSAKIAWKIEHFVVSFIHLSMLRLNVLRMFLIFNEKMYNIVVVLSVCFSHSFGFIRLFDILT